MVVEKQPYKFSMEPWIFQPSTTETGIFLMSVILVKENDADFIEAIYENTDLQNALLMKYTPPWGDGLETVILYYKEINDYVMQYAVNFLSNK